MDQIELLGPNHDFFLNGEVSKKRKIIFRADPLRVTHGLGCKALVWKGALWINAEPNRMIMVPTNRGRSMVPDPLNHLMRSWAIVDKIAQAPELVIALFREGFERDEVRVDIRNDGYLHEAPTLNIVVSGTASKTSRYKSSP